MEDSQSSRPHALDESSISRRLMKDSQRTPLYPGIAYMLNKVNNERFLVLNESPSGLFILTNMRTARHK